MDTSKKNPFDFSQLLPGFNFLTGAAGGGAALGSGPLGHWIAPTVDTEELDRRINELKAVQYWLEQNQLGIKATIQALEVQKMTLATLRGMNLNVAQVAKAFTLPTGDANTGDTKVGRAPAAATPSAAPAGQAAGEKPMLDPVQWWGALTQQFQQIATQTMQEATQAARSAGAEVAAMAKAGAAAQEKASAAQAAAPAPAPAQKGAAAKPRAARGVARSKTARGATE